MSDLAVGLGFISVFMGPVGKALGRRISGEKGPGQRALGRTEGP